MDFKGDVGPEFAARSPGLHKFLEIHADIAEQAHSRAQVGRIAGIYPVLFAAVAAESYYLSVAGGEGKAVAVAQARESVPALPEAQRNLRLTPGAAH